MARLMVDGSGTPLDHYHTFPPAFEGSGGSYTFALFGLLILASVSLAQNVKIWRALDFHRDGYSSPVTLARIIASCLYVTLFITTFPDVVVLMLWNEVSQGTMEALWATDRFFDGLALVPFTVAVLLSVRAEDRLTDLLVSRGPPPIDFIPTGSQLRRQLLLILLIAVISGGIALGKWQGAV